MTWDEPRSEGGILGGPGSDRIDPSLRQAFYHPESVVYFIGPSVMSKGCESAARS